jgi:hypothetical protein
MIDDAESGKRQKEIFYKLFLIRINTNKIKALKDIDCGNQMRLSLL